MLEFNSKNDIITIQRSDKMKELFKNIPNSNTWITIEPLNKGWSKDNKYIITDKDDIKYLLRISDISLYEKKKHQFGLLKKLEQLNINCSKPISFGTLNETQVYMLLSYLDGVDAKSYLSSISDKEAYKLGFEAGTILKKIHGIEVEKPSTSWYEMYLKKVERKIKNAKLCELEIPNLDLLINYIYNHLYLIKDRPQLLSHGDYHNGNMIVNKGHIGIIDFDKTSVVDPYDDLKCYCWNVFESKYFATGVINGYFNNKIPDDFFPIIALYSAENNIGHLPWAIQFGEEEIKVAYKVLNSVLEWYDNFNLTIPTWYKGIPEF